MTRHGAQGVKVMTRHRAQGVKVMTRHAAQGEWWVLPRRSPGAPPAVALSQFTKFPS